MLADTQGRIVASSYRPNMGKSVFALFENTEDEFGIAVRGSAGSVYFSPMANVPERIREAAAKGRLKDLALEIHMLTPVKDSAEVGVAGHHWSARALVN